MVALQHSISDWSKLSSMSIIFCSTKKAMHNGTVFFNFLVCALLQEYKR
jgi:hypothetical protein